MANLTWNIARFIWLCFIFMTSVISAAYWRPASIVDHSLMNFHPFGFAHSYVPRFSHQPVQLFQVLHDVNRDNEREFFKDLPGYQCCQCVHEKAKVNDNIDIIKDNDEASKEPTLQEKTLEQKQPQTSFTTYWYSSSFVFDENGKRITSSRRHYEDSNGRLKDVHERNIDGKKSQTVWNCLKANEEGEHKQICEDMDQKEFDVLWSKTPFEKGEETKSEALQGSENHENQPVQVEEKMPDPDEEILLL